MTVSYYGDYSGIRAYNSLLLTDSAPDNYHDYAEDGLPDWWQVQYFGFPPNADAGPAADPLGTGQNNMFKYTAGLNPIDPSSVLRFSIARGSPQASDLKFVISPVLPDRRYELFMTADLNEANWTLVIDAEVSDQDGIRTITTRELSHGAAFFLLRISIL